MFLSFSLSLSGFFSLVPYLNEYIIHNSYLFNICNILCFSNGKEKTWIQRSASIANGLNKVSYFTDDICVSFTVSIGENIELNICNIIKIRTVECNSNEIILCHSIFVFLRWHFLIVKPYRYSLYLKHNIHLLINRNAFLCRRYSLFLFQTTSWKVPNDLL